MVVLGIIRVGSELVSDEAFNSPSHSLNLTSLGPVSLATQSVLLVSASTTYQAPFALSVAVSVRYVTKAVTLFCVISLPCRIGNLLGEQKAKRAGVAANTSIILAILIAIIWSLLFLFFRASWAHLFNNDPGVITRPLSKKDANVLHYRGCNASCLDYTPCRIVPSS